MTAISAPIPVGGWNARDALSTMPPTDAIELVNLVPAGDALKVRPGYTAYTEALGAGVQTLVTYHGATESLFACGSGKIVNVTAGGAGTTLGTGYTSNKWQTTEFKNRLIFCNGSDTVKDWDGTLLNTTSFPSFLGGNIILNGTFESDTGWTKNTGWTIGSGVATCSGAQTTLTTLWQNTPTLVNGASYSVTFTISGYSAGNVQVVVGGDGATSYGTQRSANGTYTEVIAADTDASSYFWFSADADFAGSIDNVTVRPSGSSCLISCTTHKGRVYYIERDSQSFHYAAAGAYSGTLTQYDLSQFTTTGGDLLYMISWSRDGGSGVDDLAAFVFDTGEILVYAGSDPGSATDWSMLGRFRIGQPLGRRSAIKVGGDVIILTIDGYVPLSAALQEGRYSEQSDFSHKIDTAVKTAAQAYRTQFGWEAVYWPNASLFIVNAPISAAESVQHVRSTTTGAWCKFEGIDASCWALYNNNLYFGSPDQYVYKMASTADASDFINCACTQAFTHFDLPGAKKQAVAIEPITTFAYPEYIFNYIHRDWTIDELPTPDAPPEATPSEWDVATWDVSSWVTASAVPNTSRRNITGTGYALAYSMRFKTKAQTVVWHATNIWLNRAGIV